MNAEIYQLSFDQFAKLNEGCENYHVALSAARLASERIVMMYGDEILCYVGLIPPTLLSDEAYIWMNTTEAGFAHPKILARYGKKTIETFLLKYPMIWGHCFSEKSARWLRSFGAEFTSETVFEIRRV